MLVVYPGLTLHSTASCFFFAFTIFTVCHKNRSPERVVCGYIDNTCECSAPNALQLLWCNSWCLAQKKKQLHTRTPLIPDCSLGRKDLRKLREDLKKEVSSSGRWGRSDRGPSVPLDSEELAADVPKPPGCLLAAALGGHEGGGAVAGMTEIIVMVPWRCYESFDTFRTPDVTCLLPADRLTSSLSRLFHLHDPECVSLSTLMGRQKVSCFLSDDSQPSLSDTKKWSSLLFNGSQETISPLGRNKWGQEEKRSKRASYTLCACACVSQGACVPGWIW